VKTNAPEKELSSLHNHTSSKLNKSNLPIAMQYRSSLLNPKKVEVGPSKIHRIGLFTNEGLKPKDIVIEYVGEIIRTEVGDTREKRYDESGIGDCYMFRLDNSYIIDATYFGGKARYLNHSCDANCSAKTINVDNQKHIIIRAKKAIHAGEELTYNYNFEQEEDKMSCFCGAKNCIGCLN
jgi:SET domain-containing protein